ncbi:hypothetical protein EV401DRAFT_2061455 [Pisolithus croceorrhizus]|nr:hypothetical protein EV401DRAFT_2061455 [Pisolithus croceorrhizus]
MPLLGTKSSPELFQGDCSREMVSSILQYCNTCVREIIEGMPHFHTPNWPHLKASLLCYFDADIFDEWFFERDLKALPIASLHDFRAYNRDFTQVGGWMKHKGKLTEHEHDCYFWAGLSPLLKQKDPDLNASIPFPYDEVCKAAEEVLCRDCFDADNLDLLGP